jgi:hypothetical protein
VEGVSTKALAYAGLLERAERRMSARTLLPEDIAERIDRLHPRSTGRLVAYLIAGLGLTWTDWPHFESVRPPVWLGSRPIQCDAIVAVDGIPYYKDRPEGSLDRIVPISKVRAVEIFNDPSFLPSQLDLESKKSRLDPPISCGVVAIWTDDAIASP